MRRLLAATAVFLALITRASAHPPVTSEDAACQLLKTAAVQRHLATETNPPGSYECEAAPDYRTVDHYVFGLHHRYQDKDPSWVGGNLVGWYAIRARDGEVR